MTALGEDNNRAGHREAPKALPNGYRQGVITAITVMLGFTLYFFQYWSFEAEGNWTATSRIAATLLLLSVAIQLVALWRSLQVNDDQEPIYKRTLKWFLSGIIILILAVLAATFSYTEII